MEHKIDSVKSYDLISDEWEKFRKSTPINQCIVDFCDFVVPNGRVLDVGCGTGYPIAHYLSSRGFSVTGIDPSQKMIEKAQALHLANADFIASDILNYSSELRYDGVIAFDSIWHIAKSGQPTVYRKISSLMKDEAYFIFTHGNRNDETIGTMFGRQFYYGALSIDELKGIFSEVGLKIVSLAENYKEPSTGARDLLVIAQKRASF